MYHTGKRCDTFLNIVSTVASMYSMHSNPLPTSTLKSKKNSIVTEKKPKRKVKRVRQKIFSTKALD